MTSITSLERQYAQAQISLEKWFAKHAENPSRYTGANCANARKKLDNIRYQINKQLGRTI